MGDQGKYEPVLEMDEKKPQTSSSEQEEAASSHIDIHDNLEEPFDEDFWEKVEQKFAENIAWNRAMDEVRVARWEKRYKERTLEVMIRHWPDTDKYKNRPELIASLEHQINRFTEILLEQDDTSKRKRKYRNFRVDEDDDPACPTLLHLAAERNFVHVAKSLVDKDGGALYLRTEKHGSERSYLPVEIALMKFHDETAAYLISKMKHEWIHRLFLCRGSQLKADFRFKTYILHPNMKKTVVAVLDCLINPQWPYLPAKKERYSSKAEERGIERAWSSVPDDPLNYHFLYHLLEADENGQPPKLKGSKNTLFNQSSKSALHCIAESNNKGAIQHPVVRMLVSRKWSNYAHFLFSLQALCYVFFLLVLSYALIYGSTRSNPNAYISHGDRLRALCEVISIIFIMFYIVAEANQMEKERVRYFKDFYNALDWLGLLLTLIVLPLRFSSVKEQWILASLGFLFNFMRLFKFSCVSRTTGLYTKTLAKIIYQDLTRFLVVFAVVFIAFCGALFLSLKATDSQELFSGFELILLAGIRALVEQQPFNDSYNKYRWLTTILVLIYMAMVVVILLNILIAQLSTTYEDARKIARLQYDVDRMRIISRLESSRFESFSLRVKYYEDGGWISEEKLAHELLEYDDESHPWESIEKKLSKIRDTMRKVMRGLPTLDDSY